MGEQFLDSLATWIQVAASLLSVVLALVGLRIARAAASEQRQNRDYATDRALADEFFQVVEQLVADLEAGRVDVVTAGGRFRRALTSWSRRVTQPAAQEQRDEVASFLRELERDASRALPAHSSAQVPPLKWMSYTGALRRAQQVTRAWASPEARREVLTRILHERAEDMVQPRSSPHVQAQRWLLLSDPSRSHVTQFWRSTRVWWLMFLDDARRGRLPQTVREWVEYQRRSRQELQAFKADLRRERLRAEADAPGTAEPSLSPTDFSD